MSIPKKSLISTLHAAKKANVAKADVAAHKGDKQVSAVSIQSMTRFSTRKNLRMLKTIA